MAASDVSISIGCDTTQFTAGMRAAQAMLGKSGQIFGQAGRSMSALSSALGGIGLAAGPVSMALTAVQMAAKVAWEQFQKWRDGKISAAMDAIAQAAKNASSWVSRIGDEFSRTTRLADAAAKSAERVAKANLDAALAQNELDRQRALGNAVGDKDRQDEINRTYDRNAQELKDAFALADVERKRNALIEKRKQAQEKLAELELQQKNAEDAMHKALADRDQFNSASAGHTKAWNYLNGYTEDNQAKIDKAVDETTKSYNEASKAVTAAKDALKEIRQELLDTKGDDLTAKTTAEANKAKADNADAEAKVAKEAAEAAAEATAKATSADAAKGGGFGFTQIATDRLTRIGGGVGNSSTYQNTVKKDLHTVADYSKKLFEQFRRNTQSIAVLQ